MTTNPHNFNETLPPELAAINAALDELALSERAAAGPCVEDRLFLETRARLSHAAPSEARATDAALADLASAERAAAPASLEDRIFIATRGALRQAQPQRAEVHVRRVFSLRGLRVAASFLVASGAFFGYLILRQDTTPAPKTHLASNARILESEIDNGMQDLSAAVQIAFSGSDAEKAKTTTDSSADRTEPDWFHFDEFFDKEGSL
jgi:hypothetical protein